MTDFIPEPDLGGVGRFLTDLFNGFSYFWYTFFRYGNYILFAIFAIMGLVLFLNSREKEYDERIHGKEELVKKRGRAGSLICLLLAFAFLSTRFTRFLYDIYENVPEPQLIIRFVGDKLASTNSLEEVLTLGLWERFFFLAVSFCSFVSFLLISIGIYLMSFNKFILQSKWKFFAFIAVGFVFWLIVGFKASLKLLV